jgi:hypothetical protein
LDGAEEVRELSHSGESARDAMERKQSRQLGAYNAMT